MTEPLHLSFEVDCQPAAAFATWTTRASTWWPADHTVSCERGVQIVFEEGVGGRIFERTPGGVEHEWGRVTLWDPPDRLGYTWHLRFSPEDATDVVIRFVPSGDDRTRVEIQHSGWDRLGETGLQRRDGNRLGWLAVFPHFAEAIEKGAA